MYVCGFIRNIKKNIKKTELSENSNLFECFNDIVVHHILSMHLTCDQSCELVVTSVHTGDKSVVG